MASALITAGVKRIGKAMVLALANKGYDIAIHYHSSRSDAEILSQDIQSLGRVCKIYQADLTDEQDILNLLPRVQKDFPDLEVLVNNASIFEPATLTQTDMESFNRHFAVNFKAPYFLTKDFASICQTGNIINILDTRITNNDFSYCAYSLAKKALADLTRMSALELAPEIRVNGICPGFILNHKGCTKAYVEKLKQKIPMKAQGNVEQICQALLYLLDNVFITGQFIFIDGGQNL